MKSVGRRSLALILAVLMTLSLMSTVSFAEGNVAADAQNQEADKQVVQEVQPDAAEAPAAVAEDKTEAEAPAAVAEDKTEAPAAVAEDKTEAKRSQLTREYSPQTLS